MENWDSLACLEGHVGTRKPLSQKVSKQGRHLMPHRLLLPLFHGMDSVGFVCLESRPPSAVSTLWAATHPWLSDCLLWGCWPTPGQSSGAQSWDFDRIIRNVGFLSAGTKSYRKTAETRIMAARTWGGREMKSCCLVGIEFPFCSMKKFWRSAAQQCDPYYWPVRLKIVRRANFMGFLNHNKKNK